MLTSVLEGRPKCHLTWHSDTCFVVGWEQIVQICHIFWPQKPSSSNEIALWNSNTSNDETDSLISSASTVALNSQFKVCVQITAQLDLGQSYDSNVVICGVATHQNHVLVLAYPSKTIESLLVVEEGQDRLPKLLVYDSAGPLFTPVTPPSEIDSIMSSEEDLFEEIGREDVDLKMLPEYEFQGLGLGKSSLNAARLLF